MQHDRESRTVCLLRDQVRRSPELFVYIEASKIFYDLDSSGSYDSTYVPRQALITSSSRKPSLEFGMLRNTREDMSILRNVFDRQRARPDPVELYNDSRILDSENRRN